MKDKRVANEVFLYFKDVELNSKKNYVIDIYNGIAKVNYFKKQKINQVVQYTVH
jgi:hypothetical protein